MSNHWVWLIIMNDDAFPVNGIDLIVGTGVEEEGKSIVMIVDRNRKPPCFQAAHDHTHTHTHVHLIVIVVRPVRKRFNWSAAISSR